MKKGKFVTIYGINNIGKSTHARLLVKRLEELGEKALYVKFPVYDMEPSGGFINDVLRNPNGQAISEEELQMWYTINRYQFQPTLTALLEEGTHVIAEDYRFTGIAWGMAKGLDEDWITNLNSNLVPEDVIVYFQGERDLNAVEKIHIHEQNPEIMEKSRKTHDYLAKKYGWHRVRLQPKIKDTAGLLWAIIEKELF